MQLDRKRTTAILALANSGLSSRCFPIALSHAPVSSFQQPLALHRRVHGSANSLIGVIDSYGIELMHPRREGRSKRSHRQERHLQTRWIVAASSALCSTTWGASLTGNVTRPTSMMARPFSTWSTSFRHEWSSFLTPVLRRRLASNQPACLPAWRMECAHGCRNGSLHADLHLRFKHMAHKVWRYFEAHVGWTLALFNILVEWNGFIPDDDGFVHLSIAEFSL